MIDLHRRVACLYPILLILLLLIAGVAQAQPPFYRVGAPYPPARDPRLTTDNGIPGTGYYYFRDYPYPSLREALQTYGWFGRRFHPSRAELRRISSEPRP
jgi:hypothetical protein